MSTAIGISGKRHAPLPERNAPGGNRLAGARPRPHRATDLEAGTEDRLGGRVFPARSDALEQLQRRIEALGRRARRIGVGPVRLLDTGERDAGGHAFVVLRGRAPVLAGWTLAAIVDHRDGRATVRPAGEQGEHLAPRHVHRRDLRALRAAPPAHPDVRRRAPAHRRGAPGRVGLPAGLPRRPRPRAGVPTGRAPGARPGRTGARRHARHRQVAGAEWRGVRRPRRPDRARPRLHRARAGETHVETRDCGPG